MERQCILVSQRWHVSRWIYTGDVIVFFHPPKHWSREGILSHTSCSSPEDIIKYMPGTPVYGFRVQRLFIYKPFNMALQEGKKIWLESLMTPEEWKVRTKKYSTSHLPEPPQEFDGDYKWRKGMGASPSQKEIDIYNHRMDILRKEVMV